MKSRAFVCAAMALLATLALPVGMAAQAGHLQPHQYHHYQIIDPGTFGGPQNWLFNPDWAPFGFLTNQGTLAGAADTSAVDPYCFWSLADCFATHGFQWREGLTTNLGVLPGGIGSQVNWISANGLMAGIADNGQQDPLQPAFPQIHGVLWDHGKMTDLGTLPAGGYDMWANVVNNSGEIAGQAYNTIPDANSFFGYGYQSRAIYWKNGVTQDLGTLGTGSDAIAIMINERGQVLGVSYINSIPSTFCSGVQLGFVFATGSFLWDKKNGMQDLGGFGGTCTVAYDLNNRGQVVGQSNHSDDLDQHPFVWDRAHGMIELPTAAGIYGNAGAINDAGEIVGQGDGPDGQPSAILWGKRGGKWHATYLGSLQSGDCATGISVNASGQVVGYSGPNGCVTVLPFLWEDGGAMVDLNTLVSSTSGLQLYEADQINDRGEILAQGLDASLNNHAVLLIPCDENHPDVTGCAYSLVDASAAGLVNPVPPIRLPAVLTPNGSAPGMLNRFHSPSGRKTPRPGTVAAPTMPLSAAATATSDWLGDHKLSPLAGNPNAHCEIRAGVLTGRCIDAPGGNICTLTSVGCTAGQAATSGGFVTCFNGAQYEISTIQCPGVVNSDFTVSASALTPATVSPGGSSTATVDVTAFGGFSDTVVFTCSVTPSAVLAPTCAINPGSVTPATSATLSVSTTPPSSALLHSTGSRLSYALWLPLFGLLAGAGFGSRRKGSKGKAVAAALACLVLIVLVFQPACGSSKAGTPAGAYTVTLTGTDAPSSLVRSTTVTLTVQ